MNLDIIIPAWNEEKHIKEVLREIDKTEFPTFIDKVYVTVIDDCSTDKTYETANSYVPANFSLAIIRKTKNEGKGAAVHEGIRNSTAELIIIQDADMELLPSEIPFLIEKLQKENAQFVNGSRYLGKNLKNSRDFFNKLFSAITGAVLLRKVTDVACGYKLFRRDLFEKLDLKEIKFGFEAEFLIKASRLQKGKIHEVPVSYIPRNKDEGKKIRNTDALRILWVIFTCGMLRMK